MYLIQCNLHLATCVEADRKDAFSERIEVWILFWWYCMLQLCQCLLFSHDFATSSRFPSFSPMICVWTLFIPLLLSGMTNTTCLKFFVFFFHKFGYFTLLTFNLISHWKRNSISLHDHVLLSKSLCTLRSHILNYTFNAHRSY